MDITPLFKACIKTVKARNKAFGKVTETDKDKQRILKPRTKTAFMTAAKDITLQITRLRDFLLEHREGYLNFLVSGGSGDMTDAERDQIDTGAQRIINTCQHLVKEFRNDNRKVSVSPQVREYMDAVIELIDAYLKSVCKMHSELKAIRVKRALDIRKLGKLEISSVKPSFQIKQDSLLPEVEKEGIIVDENLDKNGTKMQDATSELETNIASETEGISPEELQMFEEENAQLYNELDTLSEEVKQIESKVLQIAELQEIFTEKVVQQEAGVENVWVRVGGARQDVVDANAQLRQAMQRNASTRVYILFFLLVMAFSLLFLHWYND